MPDDLTDFSGLTYQGFDRATLQALFSRAGEHRPSVWIDWEDLQRAFCTLQPRSPTAPLSPVEEAYLDIGDFVD